MTTREITRGAGKIHDINTAPLMLTAAIHSAQMQKTCIVLYFDGQNNAYDVCTWGEYTAGDIPEDAVEAVITPLKNGNMLVQMYDTEETYTAELLM